jgi:hypothetical protein
MGLFTRKPKAPTIAIGGEYFNTHPALRGHYDALWLTMTDAGIEAEVGKKKDKKLLHTFKWDEVVSFEDEHQTETQGGGQRLTGTRMATMGVFSLAAPKATGRVDSKYVNTLHTTTGDIELELKLSTDAGSAIGRLANDAIKKHSHKVRAFVADRACAPR